MDLCTHDKGATGQPCSSARERAILITSPDQISADWLTRRLRDGGFLPYFRVNDIRLMDRAESESATRYTLRIRYSDISVTRSLPDYMVLKVSHAGHPLADKEVTFYLTLLPGMRQAVGAGDLGVCDCFDACYDVDADQSHVLIAGLPTGYKLHHEPIPPSRRHFAQLADALAKIHASHWQDTRLGNTIGLALTEARLDDNLARQQDGFERFLSDGMIRLDPAQYAALSAVAGRMPADFRERLLAGRQLTVIHNNLKPGNLLYSHQACRILDWKHWRTGLAAEDLAYLIAFHWPPAKRKFEEPRFLQRHWAVIRRRGASDYAYDEFLRDYRTAVGLRLGEMIGAWRVEDWRDGKWRLWDSVLAGLRAFEEHNVKQLFPS